MLESVERSVVHNSVSDSEYILVFDRTLDRTLDALYCSVEGRRHGYFLQVLYCTAPY